MRWRAFQSSHQIRLMESMPPPVVRSCLLASRAIQFLMSGAEFIASCAGMPSSRSTKFAWWKARQPLRLEIVPDYRQFWIQCFARHAFRSLHEIRLAESTSTLEVYWCLFASFADMLSSRSTRFAWWKARRLLRLEIVPNCVLYGFSILHAMLFGARDR